MAESFSTIFYPLLWLVLAIGLIVAESISVQLVAIWFSLGSLAAIIPAVFSAPFLVQLLVFSIVSAIALLAFRPFAKRYLRPREVRTNADRVIGETAIVLEAIDNIASKGRVSVMGLDWAARSTNGELIAVGESVSVQAMEGVTLMVTSLVVVSSKQLEEAIQ